MLSQVDLNTWLWKGKMMFYFSPWPSPRLVGMACRLFLTRNQSVGGTKCPGENVPCLIAFGSTQVLCCTSSWEGKCAPEYTREFTENVRKTSPLWSALFDLVSVIPAPKSRRVLLWELGPTSARLSAPGCLYYFCNSAITWQRNSPMSQHSRARLFLPGQERQHRLAELHWSLCIKIDGFLVFCSMLLWWPRNVKCACVCAAS